MTESLITQHIDLWTSAIEAKSTAGRGSKNKFDLYGIKKLRELILELAVRGKLVPQDPTDEPASVLLERIAAEKTRLVKENKIKKTKELLPITDDEKPFKLPLGWIWGRWEEIAMQIGDIDHKMPNSQISGYPYISPKDFTETNGIDFLNAKKISDVDFKALSKKTQPKRGDIIFPRYGTIGDNRLVDTDIDFIASYSCCVIKILNGCFDPKFQYFVSLSGVIKRQTDNAVNKTTQPNVGIKSIQNFIIPIPPLTEQIRIVAKVEELMALCDQLEQQTLSSIDAHATLVDTLLETLTNSADAAELEQNWARISEHFDTLFITEQSIDALKQTILQLAVMGKLVRQDPTDEPASVLLEKIAAEKAQLIKDKKIKKEKPLPPISDDEKPFELPQGWEWCRLGSITSSRLGKMLDNAKNKGVMKKYLRNTNVQWGMIDLSDLKEMKFEESEFEEFRLKSGDLLVCEGGEPGRCAIWELDDSDIFFQKALHRVRTYAGVDASFIEINLLVSAGNGGLDGLVTGATIKHLPGDKLAIYPIPLPPLKMQIKIIKKVKKLLMLCDELKNKLKNNRETKLHITDSIIDKVIV